LPCRLRLQGLAPGVRAFAREGDPASAPAGRAAIDDVLEFELPFEALGTKPEQVLEMLLHIERGAERIETLPPGQVLRVRLPGRDWDASNWSA
jgi:hypothetical protein